MSTNPSVETSTPTPSPNLIVGLSMAGGLGILLVIIGFLIGVFDPGLSSSIVGVTVLAGILCIVGSVVAWAAVVRPFDNFDDINVAQYHGHEHHDDHAHEEHDGETEGEVHTEATVPADNVKVYPVPSTDTLHH